MLTDRAIKALRSQKKLYKVSDRDGMYVVVQPSGAIVFRYDYRLNSRRETLTADSIGSAEPPWFHVALRFCPPMKKSMLAVGTPTEPA